MIRIVIISLICLLGFSQGTPALARTPDPIYTSWRNNLAIEGYDAVSFFSGKPVSGRAEYTTEHLGAVWQFSSQANLDLFQTNPEAFMPRYGGYCAWAVAYGKLVKGDPEYWVIHDGALYLNFNARIQQQWLDDMRQLIPLADENWQKLMSAD